MNDQDTGKRTGIGFDMSDRPDLEGEEYRDSTHYKPISTREYFKVLVYCVIGLIAVVLAIFLFTVVVG
jgi:hypothetical protein